MEFKVFILPDERLKGFTQYINLIFRLHNIKLNLFRLMHTICKV